jgi:hypothetical protein
MPETYRVEKIKRYKKPKTSARKYEEEAMQDPEFAKMMRELKKKKTKKEESA